MKHFLKQILEWQNGVIEISSYVVSLLVVSEVSAKTQIYKKNLTFSEEASKVSNKYIYEIMNKDCKYVLNFWEEVL